MKYKLIKIVPVRTRGDDKFVYDLTLEGSIIAKVNHYSTQRDSNDDEPRVIDVLRKLQSGVKNPGCTDSFLEILQQIGLVKFNALVGWAITEKGVKAIEAASVTAVDVLLHFPINIVKTKEINQ